ncbi:MAG TPA: hypothetical protein VNM92_18825 [Thermoanaerobaculia bacterium]|nr:hypothetical protein [Thermoanaerobaculia bacterium]
MATDLYGSPPARTELHRAAGSLWWLFAAFSATAASSLILSAAPHLSTPVDHFLPVISLVVVCASWSARHHSHGSWIVLGAPLLSVAAVILRDETLRLASFGAVCAIAIAVAIAMSAHSRPEAGGRSSAVAPDETGMGLDSQQAVTLLLLAAVPLRFVPLERATAPAALIICGGLIALLFELLRGPAHQLVHLAAAMIVAAVTPDLPMKLSLFPIHLALLVRLSRTGSIASAVLSLGVALACGKWALMQWLIVALISWSTQVVSGHGTPSFSLMKLPVAPTWTLRFAELARTMTGHGPLIISLLFFTSAFFLRPALSLLFVLAGIVFAVSGAALPSRSTTSPLLALALSMVALFPWSGALAATFPLPVPLSALILLAALLFLAHAGTAMAAILGMLLLLASYWALAPAHPAYPVGVTLKPGETFNLPPEAEARTISLIVSGSNIAQLGRHSPLARIEVLDRRGNAYRRDLAIGDASDWAAYRRDVFFLTRNPVPADSSNRVEGYGRSAFLRGAGRLAIRLPQEIAMIRVTASRTLPANATIQLDAIEYRKP